MPPGNPQLGEVWATSDPGSGRSVQGVVSDIVTNVITMVSFTGNRVRVPPERFVQTWSFVQAPPRTHLRCQTRNCGQAATFLIQRGASPEFLCPRHMLSGVRATLIPESPPGMLPSQEGPERHVPSCPFCHQDRLIPQETPADLATLHFNLFHCSGCNTQSFYQEPPQLQEIAQLILRRPQLTEAHLGLEAWRELHGEPGGVEPPDPNRTPRTPLLSVQAVFNNTLGSAVALRATGAARVAGLRANQILERAEARLEPPPLLLSPAIESQWTNRHTGTIVQVTKTTDKAVHFQAISDGNRGIMTFPDFYEYHRKTEPREVPLSALVMSAGEEWVVEGVVYRIVERNNRTSALVVETSDGERFSIAFSEVNPTNWKRLHRPTIYSRLTREEEDF